MDIEIVVTEKSEWYRVETTEGTYFLPSDVDPKEGFIEDAILECSTFQGYGVRLAGQAVADPIEWLVFEQRTEAISKAFDLARHDWRLRADVRAIADIMLEHYQVEKTKDGRAWIVVQNRGQIDRNAYTQDADAYQTALSLDEKYRRHAVE